MRFVLFVISMVTLAGLAAACSSEDKGGGKVNVALKEWGVSTDRPDVPKGDVQFEVKNEGPDHDHEMIIIRTDLAPDKLPTKDDGSVDESAGGIDVMKRINSFEPDRTNGATYTLNAGKYVLVCNLVDNHGGEQLVHYELGMRAALTITE